jgi:hypothetical protein
MTEPAPGETRRDPAHGFRGAGGRIVGAAIVLLLVLGYCVRERGTAAAALFPFLRERSTVSHDLVVQKVQAVSKLLTSETTLRDVVAYDNTKYGLTKKTLLVVTGKILAGVDLKDGTEVNIDDRAHRIEVTLPPAQIFGVQVLDVRTYDEQDTPFNRFTPEDRDEIQRRVRAQLLQAGTELGVIEHANQSAKTMLENLLAVNGYTVDVQTRSRPIVPAPVQ